MEIYSYVKDFEKLGFGLFVHFGLYSMLKKGEWTEYLHDIPVGEYEKLKNEFNPDKNWAKELVQTAKSAGCKYITLTTRHHDGFSLYDTLGLNDFDAPHSLCKRDLIREFVDECSKENIVPFFYHTLLDWRNKDYKNNFSAYIDYLCKSIEILSKNYGKVGGFWFDGMWDKPNDDWQEDRLYGTIRKYQPTAMIINNTGLSATGKTGHREIDSVTFERGKPCFVDMSEKYLAGEMCQILNDHWGYCEDDCNYKSVKDLVGDLLTCRLNNCNFLLNTGLKGDGTVNLYDKCLLSEIGKWVKRTGSFIYNSRACDIKCDGADILFDGEYHYAIVSDVRMTADKNVQLSSEDKVVKIHANIKDAIYLDNGETVKVNGGEFTVNPFKYGTSLSYRVIRFKV